MVSAIVAVDNSYGIGRNNELLINIPDDLKRFSQLTRDSIVIMGRKTYESLPKKPLPNRINIVITRSGTDNIKNLNIEHPIFVSMEKVKEWLSKLEQIGDDSISVFIIGGGQIYKELLSYCHTIYLTRILTNFDGVDTYFPNLDIMDNWTIDDVGDVDKYHDIEFQYVKYIRQTGR